MRCKYTDFLFKAIEEIEYFHEFYNRPVASGFYTIPFVDESDNIYIHFDACKEVWTLYMKEYSRHFTITINDEGSAVILYCSEFEDAVDLENVVGYLYKIGTTPIIKNYDRISTTKKEAKKSDKNSAKRNTDKHNEKDNIEDVVKSLTKTLNEYQKQFNCTDKNDSEYSIRIVFI